MIAGPLALIGFPLVFSFVVWLLRRWAFAAAWLSTCLTGAMALMVLRLPLDRPVQLLGRQIALGQTVALLGRDFVLSPADRLNLVFVYLTAAGLFLFAWRVSQGWTFFPLSLVLLSVLGCALLSNSHIFAVLFLQIAATLCVFLIQGGQTGSTRGALRFLTFVTLAIPPLLVTSWLLGRYELTPDDTSLLDTSSLLFAFGFAILLGAVPFHIWIPAVSADAPPLVTTFVLGIFYSVVWFVMLNLIQSFEWLATHPDFDAAFRVSGYAMIVVGAGLAAIERRLGRLMGYAALADMGAAQLALALQTPAGLNAALLALGTRAVSLAVMSMGISLIRHRAEGDEMAQLVGWGRQMPWATTAFLIGGLSLAGLPPGAGFAARWGLTHLVARQQAGGALLLLLASIGVCIGVLRGTLALLRQPAPGYVGSEIVEAIEAARQSEEKLPSREGEPRLAALIIIAGLILCIALGLFPQFHTHITRQVADSFTFLDLISP